MEGVMANPVLRLYRWVLRWAESPYGAWGLFLIAFAESSFFPIPPDILLIALAVGKPKRALRFAAICTTGSVLGGMAGYAIGFGAWSIVGSYFFQYVPGFTPEIFEQVSGMYRENAGWAVFAAGLTPIPYKVFTISGGVAQISIVTFLLASILSRGLRFFALAILIRFFGAQINEFIQKYFNILSILFTVLLIGGFILLKNIF